MVADFFPPSELNIFFIFENVGIFCSNMLKNGKINIKGAKENVSNLICDLPLKNNRRKPMWNVLQL
jgi:hypothetical protein